jgi:hypothetical protein
LLAYRGKESTIPLHHLIHPPPCLSTTSFLLLHVEFVNPLLFLLDWLALAQPMICPARERQCVSFARLWHITYAPSDVFSFPCWKQLAIVQQTHQLGHSNCICFLFWPVSDCLENTSYINISCNDWPQMNDNRLCLLLIIHPWRALSSTLYQHLPEQCCWCVVVSGNRLIGDSWSLSLCSPNL